jgi:ribosome-associated protein
MNEPIRAQPSTPSAANLQAARQFALQAAWLAANTRCHDVVVLDVGGLSPVCDYFVIASGTSARQMRTVADEISELGEKSGFRSYGAAGYEGESWILVDFIDVVVHLFSDEARRFYDLDNLWGDAKRVDWKSQATPVCAARAD